MNTNDLPAAAIEAINAARGPLNAGLPWTVKVVKTDDTARPYVALRQTDTGWSIEAAYATAAAARRCARSLA